MITTDTRESWTKYLPYFAPDSTARHEQKHAPWIGGCTSCRETASPADQYTQREAYPDLLVRVPMDKDTCLWEVRVGRKGGLKANVFELPINHNLLVACKPIGIDGVAY